MQSLLLYNYYCFNTNDVVINISVVIPTCNRKQRLLSLLKNLNESFYPLCEIIVVDSGEERLTAEELNNFKSFPLVYINAEKSVCIQRNIGIALAKGEWIFVCDDDIEVPTDYVEKIAAHLVKNADAVAISGLVLQKEKEEWVSNYPVSSTKDLLWKYIFKLGIWGEIKCHDNLISRRLKKYYVTKGNHISKAGWPVITNFSGEYFTVPVYGLGASVIKKEWLVKFPYDETLDSHGIGDNYGLSINLPEHSIHILNNAFVYHHHEIINRLQRPVQYYRRVMALDYFRRTNKNIKFVKKRWLVWSLLGNMLSFIFTLDARMIRPGFISIINVLFNSNPYIKSKA